MRRVVVTGLGLVTPLAAGLEASWKRLLNGESGAGKIKKFETDRFPCTIAAEVPRSDGYAGGDKIGKDAMVWRPRKWPLMMRALIYPRALRKSVQGR